MLLHCGLGVFPQFEHTLALGKSASLQSLQSYIYYGMMCK